MAFFILYTWSGLLDMYNRTGNYYPMQTSSTAEANYQCLCAEAAPLARRNVTAVSLNGLRSTISNGVQNIMRAVRSSHVYRLTVNPLMRDINMYIRALRTVIDDAVIEFSSGNVYLEQSAASSVIIFSDIRRYYYNFFLWLLESVEQLRLN